VRSDEEQRGHKGIVATLRDQLTPDQRRRTRRQCSPAAKVALNLVHHRRIVSWLTSRPRSASRSCTSRKLTPRQCRRTRCAAPRLEPTAGQSRIGVLQTPVNPRRRLLWIRSQGAGRPPSLGSVAPPAAGVPWSFRSSFGWRRRVCSCAASALFCLPL
jgi:hypothetical protein